MMFFLAVLLGAQASEVQPIDFNVLFASLGGFATLIAVLVGLWQGHKTRGEIRQKDEALQEIRVNVNGGTERLLREIGELTWYNQRLVEALAQAGIPIPPMEEKSA
jgi:hypothetical protein